jgi:O-antigen ligase
MSFPELGITAVILLIPLSNIFENPSIAILVVIVPTVFSYLFKFLRSKRVMRFELLDVFVLVFGALTLFGGIFTRGDISSLQGAAAYAAFLSIYFLIVNSYIRKTWIYRGIKLIVISTAIVALVGIIEGGVTEAAWIDASMFADITERVSAFLGNPNMLGGYFVIVFPLIIAEVVVSRSVFAKIGYFLCAVTVLVCTVLTWSRGAWLGLIIGVLVFMLIYNYRSFWLMVGAVMTLPIWVTFLPDSIIRRFMSIFTMSDSSVIYRFNTWRGVLSMIADNLFGGIGVGESAFGKVYPFYALEGTEGVMHSHSIYLQILLALGIIGALVFGLIIISYIQKCFVTLKYKDNKRRSKSMIAAGIASITGALVVGLTDHIWYNYRVFLIFWVVMALTVALTKINEREKAKREANEINNSRSSDLDIYF